MCIKLMCFIIFLGCESTALSLNVIQSPTLVISPPFIQNETREIKVNFPDFVHLNHTIGEVSEEDVVRALLMSDFGPDVHVLSWRFEGEFQLILELERNDGAPYGEYEVLLEISNQFGTFVGRGEFFVF